MQGSYPVNSEDDGMRPQDVVMKLRADAANCRRLARAASDPEAADALLEIADDIDAAISAFERTYSDGDEGVQQRR
jgi:hypothetical protein